MKWVILAEVFVTWPVFWGQFWGQWKHGEQVFLKVRLLLSLVQVINHLFLSPLQSVCCHSCLVSSSSNEHGVFRIAFFLCVLPLTSSVIYVGDRCSHKYTHTPGTCRTSHKSASRSDHSKPPSTVYWTTKSVNAWVKQLWISAVKDDRDHVGFYVDLI